MSLEKYSRKNLDWIQTIQRKLFANAGGEASWTFEG
jgi:hypothetical protein